MEKFIDDQSGEELYAFITKKMTALTTEDVCGKPSSLRRSGADG